MAKEIREPDPPDQSWLLTFSDCMTLLLCFFVLLLTFSSFEEIKFEQLAGAFRTMSYTWLEENRITPKEGLLERPEDQNAVNDGAQVKTDQDRSLDPPEKTVELLDQDMYKDRVILYLPSTEMFMGHTRHLQEPGRRFLYSLAKFLNMQECRVVIGETSLDEAGGLGAMRSWTTMEFFVRVGLDRDRFSIDGECSEGLQRFPDQKVLMITLLKVKLDKDR